MNYIDLTHTITNNMPCHPLDDTIQIKSTATCHEQGMANESLSGSVHMGTHIDAPGHFIANGKKITDFPIDRFMGQAVCIDARNQKVITSDMLADIALHKDIIVIFCTEWDTKLHEPGYYLDHPVISAECTEYLISTGIKMVGVDMPSVDNEPYDIHKLFLSNDILIIENLTNLTDLIGKAFNIIALPLKIDAHGAPARVIAQLT